MLVGKDMQDLGMQIEKHFKFEHAHLEYIKDLILIPKFYVLLENMKKIDNSVIDKNKYRGMNVDFDFSHGNIKPDYIELTLDGYLYFLFIKKTQAFVFDKEKSEEELKYYIKDSEEQLKDYVKDREENINEDLQEEEYLQEEINKILHLLKMLDEIEKDFNDMLQDKIDIELMRKENNHEKTGI